MEQTTTHRVAGQVRGILAQRRLTGRWLAAQLGMPQSTLSRRLIGEIPFTVDQLAAVARVLGVSPASLLPEDREPVATSGAA